MTIKVVIILIVVLVLGFFLFKDKIPVGSSPSGQKSPESAQKSEVKSMTMEEVSALGGTCFKSAFEDEVEDVEVSVEGEPRRKTPEKTEYDIRRITIGRDGDSLMERWEFVGDIKKWLGDHNVRIITYRGMDKGDDDRFDVEKNAHDSHWTGQLVRGAETTSFDPQVRVHSDGIQFVIPWALIARSDVVDVLAFTSDFYHKPSSEMYFDMLWPPKNKRSTQGHFTSFFCDK